MSRTRNALVFSVSSLLVGAALLAGCDDTTGTGGAGGATSSSTGTGTSTTGSTTNASSSGQTSSASGSTSSASGSSGSTTSSSSSGSSSASSSSSSASSSSGGAMTLNGCTAATAEDHTAEAAVTINFGGAAGFAYTPPCIKVAAGTKVTFDGAFLSHPLRGGTVVGGIGTVDPNSPITSTDTGTSATFMLASAGDFGFYCNFHAMFGMMGAIFVQ